MVEDLVRIVGGPRLPEVFDRGVLGLRGSLMDQLPGDFRMGQALGELERFVEGGEPGGIPGRLVGSEFEKDLRGGVEENAEKDLEIGV